MIGPNLKWHDWVHCNIPPANFNKGKTLFVYYHSEDGDYIITYRSQMRYLNPDDYTWKDYTGDWIILDIHNTQYWALLDE